MEENKLKEYQKRYKKDHAEEIKKYQYDYQRTYKVRNKEIRNGCARLKRHAKKIDKECKLTCAQYGNKIKKPCYYCGGDGFVLDRLNSDIGYILENVISCCERCNKLRKFFNIEELKRVMEMVLDMRNKNGLD